MPKEIREELVVPLIIIAALGFGRVRISVVVATA